MELAELLEIAEKEQASRKPIRVHCCTAAGCASSNSEQVKKSLDEALKATDLHNTVEVCSVGCMKFCGRGPLVEIESKGLLYEQVTPEQAPAIVAAMNGGSQDDSDGLIPLDPQHPFFTLQQPIVLENSGKINPERIEEYIAVGGYQNLYKVLHDMTPEEVVDEITQSGLRGRGGGGYPTGLKWATVAKMPGDQKYVICNADEGDPGAFMDRSVLESDPHRIIEGMAIAGYAVGANHGYIYVRAEYPLAIKHLQKAITQAKKYGLMGSQIFDSPFDFKIDIRVGAGAFVSVVKKLP